MIEWIQKNPQWIGIVIFTVFECWLGRTKKTKASSTLDLLLIALSKTLELILRLLFHKKSQGGKDESGN